MFGIAGNYNRERSSQQSSSQSQNSSQNWAGLGPEEKNAASRFFGGNRLFESGNNFLNNMSAPIASLPTLNVGPMGLFNEQVEGADRLLSTLASKYSSNLATRGFLNPQASQAVVGSAFQNALPQLLGMGQQNVLSAYGAATDAARYGEATRMNRANQQLDFWRTLQGLLGGYGSSAASSSSQSSGEGSGFGVGGSLKGDQE